MKSRMRVLGMLVLFCVGAFAISAGLDYGARVSGDEPNLLVDRLGRSDPVVVSNGYLFMEFEYVPSPYVIQRVGQAVLVNSIVVNCLIHDKPPTADSTDNACSNRLVSVSGLDGDIPKKVAEVHMWRLTRALQGGAVFLARERYQERLGRQENQMSLILPLWQELNSQRFRSLLAAALTDEPEDTKLTAIEGLGFWRNPRDGDIRLFVRNAVASSNLLHRARREFSIIPAAAQDESDGDKSETPR